MAIDKTKIFAKACHVYVAGRTDASTPVAHTAGTDWSDVGTLKADSIKLSTDKHEIALHDGEMQLLGVTLKFEAEGLETDSAKLTILEGMLNKKCDIILRPIIASDTACIKLLGMNVSVGLSGAFSAKDAIITAISGQAMGKKPSDVYTEATVSWSK